MCSWRRLDDRREPRGISCEGRHTRGTPAAERQEIKRRGGRRCRTLAREWFGIGAREEFAAARGFFLSAWNGTSGYTFDRVIRGVTHIDAACVSMIGTTQRGRMVDYIRRPWKENDDGMIQRFGVLSWPDASPDWKNVDRWPDSNARERAWATFERLASLDPDSVDAQSDKFDALRFLRLDPTAQAAFDEWRGNLE